MVHWNDGSTSWEPLADLKESYPLDLAESAVQEGIDSEPAFSWWVPCTIRRGKRIVAAANKHYHKRTNKFGIKIPKSVQHALELDRHNGNTLRMDALCKEIANVRIAFEVFSQEDNVPLNYQKIEAHVVWMSKWGC